MCYLYQIGIFDTKWNIKNSLFSQDYHPFNSTTKMEYKEGTKIISLFDMIIKIIYIVVNISNVLHFS